MSADRPWLSPPVEEEIEDNPHVVVFATTSLHTRLALDVRRSVTVAGLKKNLMLAHSSCFPSFGEIKINSVKVKHRGNFFLLSDSILVGTIIDGTRNEVFIYVDALTSVEHDQEPVLVKYAKECNEFRSGATSAVCVVNVQLNIPPLRGDMMMEIEGKDVVIELGEGYPSFDLEKAVCNHGMFMMAPNRWISETSTLQRPLRLADATTSVIVSISQQVRLDSHRIIIRTHGPHPHLSSADYHIITKQVHRMLRIFEKDERMMDEFHKLHPLAKKDGFGRIFRSPSLFEDAVKIMLLCNCDWARTLKMTRALCWLQLKIANDETEMLYRQQPNKDNQERWDMNGLIGDFPSAKEIISLRKGFLKKWCNVGYRDKWIFNLARKVVKGKVNILGELERMGMAGEQNELIQMKDRITGKRGIKGIGDFGYNALLMCVGVYSLVPVDSETIEHMKTAHGKTNYDEKKMKDEVAVVYHKYAPFQSLVYWWEKINNYESRLGKLSQLAKEDYYKVTRSF